MKHSKNQKLSPIYLSMINWSKPLITIVIVLLFLEISIRISIYFRNQNNFERVMQNLPEIKNSSKVTLGKMIQSSIFQKIIYELRPNINVVYQNVNVQINSQGWRDREYPIHKSENVVRIVGLGDSCMFGFGVPHNKDYEAILERDLNLKFPDKKWEIINTAVPGYNTVMEVETLKQKALIYKPDIVFIEFICNDLDLPNFIYVTRNCLSLKKLYSIDFFLKKYKILRGNFELFHAPHQKGDSRFF